MKIKIKKIIIFIVCICILFSFTGCLKNFDVSRLIDEPTPYQAPEISEWEEKIYPPEVKEEYKGAYIDVNPIFGDKIRIKSMEYIAQQILEASKDEGRIIDTESSKIGYKNKIDIYSAQDKLLGSFEFSSDFMLYARTDKDAPIFLIPEYAYYTIESCLLQIGSSLVEPMEKWTRYEPLGDERAEYDISMLELRFAHDVKTILIQKYGLSEAYFLNHKIYTTAEYSSSKILTVRVYALLGYAGYSQKEGELCETCAEGEPVEGCEKCKENFFGPDYHVETAARLVYMLTEGKYFRLVEYNEPAKYNPDFPSTLETRIRNIFPYKYMKDVMAALKDTSSIRLDTHRQALDYLRASSQGDLEIDD